jgi:hypothetical protein
MFSEVETGKTYLPALPGTYKLFVSITRNVGSMDADGLVAHGAEFLDYIVRGGSVGQHP